MAEIVISPATADRLPDAEHALSGGGDGHSCQCQWWTITNAEFQRASLDEKRKLLRKELKSPEPPPALIAYVDGEAAGWVRVGPRTAQVRISRTRDIVANTPVALDDPDAWAVTCFVVRREHRGQGLTTSLLAAAVDYAREHGAQLVEGYPVRTGGSRMTSAGLHTGTERMFEGEGFAVAAETSSGAKAGTPRLVMRRDP